MKKQFSIGGTQFAAIRGNRHNRPHWLLQLCETGEVFGPGVGGISNESVPKMQAYLQRLFDQVSAGDVIDFRRRFDLPGQAAEQMAKVTVLPYGYAQAARELGYTKLSKVIHARQAEILSQYAGDDLAFVQGAEIFGTSNVFEYACFERTST